MLRTDDFIKGQLVLIAWRYANLYGAGGPKPAQMIMSCIGNRVRCGQGAWLEVIERIPKYAAELVQPEGFPTIWDQTLTRLLHECETIFDGSAKDLTGGALYWADLRKIETDWFREKILKNPKDHPRVADFNSLTFFR